MKILRSFQFVLTKPGKFKYVENINFQKTKSSICGLSVPFYFERTVERLLDGIGVERGVWVQKRTSRQESNLGRCEHSCAACRR